MSDAFGVVADNLNAKADEYRTQVSSRLRTTSEAANKVRAGDTEMYGPMMTGLGVPALLDASGEKVLGLVGKLARLTDAVASALDTAAANYTDNERCARRSLKRFDVKGGNR